MRENITYSKDDIKKIKNTYVYTGDPAPLMNKSFGHLIPERYIKELEKKFENGDLDRAIFHSICQKRCFPVNNIKELEENFTHINRIIEETENFGDLKEYKICTSCEKEF